MGSGKPRMSLTARALEDSIGHWRRLSEGDEDEPAPGAFSCALCDLFLRQGCRGCPVYKRTGQSGCHGTPFYEAERLYMLYGPQSDEFKAAAKKELEFLESLRDPE